MRLPVVSLVRIISTEERLTGSTTAFSPLATEVRLVSATPTATGGSMATVSSASRITVRVYSPASCAIMVMLSVPLAVSSQA